MSSQRLEIQDARTWLPQLGALANSRLRMLIWVRAHKIMYRATNLIPNFNLNRLVTQTLSDSAI
jgi:hypothetical protein